MTREERKEQGEKKYAELFLDHYNKQKGTQFTNPKRPLQGNYDFDCTDEASGEQIAIEITNLTDEQIEQIDMALWRLLEQVKGETSGNLPGTFILEIDVPKQPLPLKQWVKKLFKEALKNSVCDRAPKLKTKQEVDLTPQIDRLIRRMSPQAFKAPSIRLKKFDDAGSLFVISSWRGNPKMELEGRDFEEFQELVRRKNRQLSQAERRETFLIVIAEGFIWANAYTIGEVFKRLDESHYCHIAHAYRIEGDRIEPIPLPHSPLP